MHTTATLGYFHPVELVDGVDPKRSLTGTTMAIGLFPLTTIPKRRGKSTSKKEIFTCDISNVIHHQIFPSKVDIGRRLLL